MVRLVRELNDVKLTIQELIALYNDSPHLILYKSDLLKTEQGKYVKEMAKLGENQNLNPLEVVLESLINLLSEKLSIESMTHSRTVAYLDKSTQDLAVARIMKLCGENPSFFMQMHKAWLQELRNCLIELKGIGVQTTEEATFRVSKRFRISGTSSLKAMTSIIRS